MSDCQSCPVETECGYEYKPCDCVGQRKFTNVARVQPPTKKVALELEKLELSDKYGSHDVARGTGRTKRMLLMAAFKLSQNNEVTIVIAAETVNYANSLKKELLDILCMTFGREFTSVHCRSRIKCDSHRGLEKLGYNGYFVFADHYSRV